MELNQILIGCRTLTRVQYKLHYTFILYYTATTTLKFSSVLPFLRNEMWFTLRVDRTIRVWSMNIYWSHTLTFIALNMVDFSIIFLIILWVRILMPGFLKNFLKSRWLIYYLQWIAVDCCLMAKPIYLIWHKTEPDNNTIINKKLASPIHLYLPPLSKAFLRIESYQDSLGEWRKSSWKRNI